jgi:hypothetical protein
VSAALNLVFGILIGMTTAAAAPACPKSEAEFKKAKGFKLNGIGDLPLGTIELYENRACYCIRKRMADVKGEEEKYSFECDLLKNLGKGKP